MILPYFRKGQPLKSPTPFFTWGGSRRECSLLSSFEDVARTRLRVFRLIRPLRRRLGARPCLVRNVEYDPVWPTELHLEVLQPFLILRRPHEAIRPHPFELLDHLVDVFDHNAEVMQPDVVEPLAQLVVGREIQDGDIARAIAQEVAVRDVARALSDFLETESCLVALPGLLAPFSPH